MNLLNRDIVNAKESLEKLMELALPVGVSYKVAKATAKIAEQLRVIGDVRNGLVKKYGEQNDRGRFEVKEDSPNWDSFQEEINELFDQEIELVIDKIKLPEKIAANCEHCGKSTSQPFQIEAKHMYALQKFVEVEK